MASLITDRNGTRRITFKDPGDGRRRTIRCGKPPKAQAETLKRRVEALVSARAMNDPVTPELAEWVRNLPDHWHSKLAAVGLLEPRESREAALTIAALVDRFIESKAVSGATAAVYKQAIDSLKAHFGEDRRIDSIDSHDADVWRRALSRSELAVATQSKRIRTVKGIFNVAARWGCIESNPFGHLKSPPQTNPSRTRYITRETIHAVLDHCPNDEWRAIVALSRFCGLRVPSEIQGLTWGDVNWARGRLTVRSPKTQGCGDGEHGVRAVPLAPEAREALLRLFEEASPGGEHLFPRLQRRGASVNLRTELLRIIRRAGETPWPRLFHNMRGSCAADWCETYPNHVCASWLGHSPLVAATHYLTTRDEHFRLAAGLPEGEGAPDSKSGAQSGARAAREPARTQDARPRTDSRDAARDDSERPTEAGLMRDDARLCDSILPGANYREFVTSGQGRIRTCEG